MARASWKYQFFLQDEVKNYSNYLIYDKTPQLGVVKRYLTITRLNYFSDLSVYTGKWSLQKHFSKYHVNFKVGQFTKTRKPFFFRSKKKKNDTKKYTLSY